MGRRERRLIYEIGGSTAMMKTLVAQLVEQHSYTRPSGGMRRQVLVGSSKLPGSIPPFFLPFILHTTPTHALWCCCGSSGAVAVVNFNFLGKQIG